MRRRAFLSLGSNSGPSEAILEAAVRELSGVLEGLAASSLWVTSPRIVLDQPDFLNMAVAGDCELEPEALLDRCQAIEARHGRNRALERPKGPRTLDIDLILYGELALSGSRLVLPHPGLWDRKFVLIPLLELDPALVLPDGRALAKAPCLLERQGIYPRTRGTYNGTLP